MASIDDIVANKKCEGDCSICLKKIEADEIITNCRLHFHRKCLNQWFEYNSICPMCRKKLDNSVSRVKFIIRIISCLLTIVILKFFILKFIEFIAVKSLNYLETVFDFTNSNILFYFFGKILKSIKKVLSYITYMYFITKISTKIIEIIEQNIFNIYKKYILL